MPPFVRCHPFRVVQPRLTTPGLVGRTDCTFQVGSDTVTRTSCRPPRGDENYRKIGKTQPSIGGNLSCPTCASPAQNGSHHVPPETCQCPQVLTKRVNSGPVELAILDIFFRCFCGQIRRNHNNHNHNKDLQHHNIFSRFCYTIHTPLNSTGTQRFGTDLCSKTQWQRFGDQI